MAEPAPVIVIGAARSGTKLLRDLLAAGRGTAAVPYDVNHVWRRGSRAPDDRLDPACLGPRQAAAIAAALQRLAGAAEGDVLIEKTVSNSLRVPFVARVLPGARFVHLIRDGRAVSESAMRLWQAGPDWRALAVKVRRLPPSGLGYAGWFAANLARGLLSRRGGGRVWGPRYPGIEADLGRPLAEICALQWRACVSRARADLAALPAGQVHEIRYEDLVAGPGAILRLAEALALPDPPASARAHAARVRAPETCRFAVLPEADRAAILPLVSPLLRDLGYADA